MKDELTKAVSRNILNNVFSLLNIYIYIYIYIYSIIFLILLITKKIILTSPLRFLIINFAIILCFKTYIKFKSNYQRSLKLLKQKSHINFNFLSNNIRGMQSSKKRLSQCFF